MQTNLVLGLLLTVRLTWLQAFSALGPLRPALHRASTSALASVSKASSKQVAFWSSWSPSCGIDYLTSCFCLTHRRNYGSWRIASWHACNSLRAWGCQLLAQLGFLIVNGWIVSQRSMLILYIYIYIYIPNILCPPCLSLLMYWWRPAPGLFACTLFMLYPANCYNVICTIECI